MELYTKSQALSLQLSDIRYVQLLCEIASFLNQTISTRSLVQDYKYD